jgi:ERCC4-type nuclease
MDKRLHKQAKELVDNFKKPVIIIEGSEFYSGFIHPNAVRGALASIAVDFGIPIIPTRSPEDTAAMINRIAIREQTHEKSSIQIRTEKKPLTTWEQQIYIVESLPNIGPVTARKLLEEFKTVRGVVNASEEDLKKVEGIGDKIAKSIIRVVDSGFKTLKSEKYLTLDLKDS